MVLLLVILITLIDMISTHFRVELRRTAASGASRTGHLVSFRNWRALCHCSPSHAAAGINRKCINQYIKVIQLILANISHINIYIYMGSSGNTVSPLGGLSRGYASEVCFGVCFGGMLRGMLRMYFSRWNLLHI